MRKNVTLEEKTEAIRSSVRSALREHALLGRSVCIWRDNKVVWLTPPEIFEELKRNTPPSLNGTTSENHE